MTMENVSQDGQSNLRLMKEMGSPNGSDPIPPSSYLYFLDDPNPVQRVLAWVRSKTIRKGHRKYYAVDLAGNTLTLSHLAADCFNGNLGNAYSAWKDAEGQGLVQKDDGRLCLCGNVAPRMATGKSIPNQQLTEDEVFCTENRSVLRTEKQRLEFLTLPAAEREAFKRACPRFREWSRAAEAEALAAVRARIAAEEKLLLDSFGICRQNGKKRPPKERPPCIELKVISVPEFYVQKTSASVQTESAVMDKAENGSVQNAPTLLGFSEEHREPLRQRESSSSAVPLEVPAAKAEEEEKDSSTLYQTFKTAYPAARFDEPKAKPSFESKTEEQQRRVIERLYVYLDCERWKGQDGRWIPFASNWLERCEAEPPPHFERRTTMSPSREALEDFLAGGGE